MRRPAAGPGLVAAGQLEPYEPAGMVDRVGVRTLASALAVGWETPRRMSSPEMPRAAVGLRSTRLASRGVVAAWLLVALFVTACRTLSPLRDVPSAATGQHFAIACDFRCGSLAVRALEVAEAVWPLAVEVWGVDPAPRRQPLRINLLFTRAAYEAVEADVSGGRLRENLSLADPATREAFIAIQPDVTAGYLDARGLPLQTLREIAHEAMHVARYSLGDPLPVPAWLNEGAAVWAEQSVLESLTLVPAVADEDPFRSTYIWFARDLLARDALPSVSRIVSDSMPGVGRAATYALHALLFDLLRESRPAALDSLASDARTLSRRSFAERFARRTRERLGDFATLDAALRDRIASLAPRWVERGRSLETYGDEWVQIAFRDGFGADAQRVEPVGSRRYAITGSLQILPGTGHRMSVTLGAGSRPGAIVSFDAVEGVRIASGANGALLSRSAAESMLGAGSPLPFRITVRADSVSVQIGRRVVASAVASAVLDGPWGLRAAPGTAGAWRGIRVLPEGPAP